MNDAMQAMCDMRPNGAPGQQACIHCGKVAKNVKPDVIVRSRCSRDAPTITASILAMAGSASEAVARKLLGRGGTRPLEEQARIIAVCGRCEHFSDGRCAACGCVLKWKISMIGEHCPLDPPKWPERAD